jgi:Fic family protein
VDKDRFTAPVFGRVITTPGRHGFNSFVPEPVPRHLDLASETVLALSEADNALGRLAGAGRLLPNPHLLVGPYVTREAVASSRIEGTQASLTDVFQAAAGGEVPVGDVREVSNYVTAMEVGLRRLTELPISLRLIREIHAVLMDGVRGGDRAPGQFRQSPNWIGSATDNPDTAVFVPPPPDEMMQSLDDLERFIHEPSTLPVLVRCALVHYQFETIHPFLDGNGRLGRLLTVFFLVEQRRLPQPLLYISTYLEKHRFEYYERLQAVRERGEIDEWLQFFLAAITEQAVDAVHRAEQLADLRETYRAALASSRSRATDVVDLLLQNPVITTAVVVNALGVTNQGALNLIRQIEAKGWLHELGRFGPGGRRYWLAVPVLRIIEDLDAGTEPTPPPVTTVVAPDGDPRA